MDFAGAYSWINIRFLLEGLWVTLEVAFLSIIFSFIIGGVLGLIRFLDIPVLSKAAGAVVDLVRNLPLLLIIFFTYFALPQIGIRLSIFWAAVAAMTIFESAMLSEIIRSGLTSIPRGQIEAGVSTGLTYGQTMWYIVIPQALRAMVPPIVSQFVALIKDTSLAVIITLPELTRNARIVYGQNTNYVIPTFLMIAFMYWVVCYLLTKFSKRLEATYN
ncbi:amino acid ABC transporter permease [Atopococcus tabaci]|uniref:amino acid ABC transporter permease n=1 Tax=Atopococcus tabaci TaxID=269774 RepID=UPI000416B5A7|nr:amino acid ABC transporter permease [Atopococcus tabaci]